MKPHKVVMRVSSAVLSVAGMNGVSVTANVPAVIEPPTGAAWRLVPKAIRPGITAPGAAALQVAAPPAPPVATSLTVTAVGTAGVNVLLINWRADVVTTPLGVTKQVQQATSCSSGEKT